MKLEQASLCLVNYSLLYIYIMNIFVPLISKEEIRMCMKFISKHSTVNVLFMSLITYHDRG